MINVTVETGGVRRTLSYPGRVSLADVLRDAGVPFCAPCGGAGVCGGCRVLASGMMTEPDSFEKRAICGADILRGVRLACRAYAVGDAFVRAPEAPVTAADAAGTAETAKNVKKERGRYGVALDIGTTTVASSLVDLLTGERVREAAAFNPQAPWGADVISRIGAISEGKTTVAELSRLVRGTADALTAALGAPDGAPRVIVGNTVMVSLFAGVDPTPIGRAPFTPPELFGKYIGGDFFPRCAGAYFGSDAAAAVLAVRELTGGDFILCDVGTNGEVASYAGGRLCVTAAAAGPAFEGAGICCGMRAERGAIDSVRIESGRTVPHVIGGGEAKGICGSGLCDACACLLALGVIDKSGYMAEPYALADGVSLTPGDIRALQLAKGAVRAAVDIVCRGAQTDGVPIYMSGAFGSSLSARSCARIGLIPGGAREVVPIGNGALRGAELMLVSDAAKEEELALASSAEYVELSGSAGFERLFLRSLDF